MGEHHGMLLLLVEKTGKLEHDIHACWFFSSLTVCGSENARIVFVVV